MQPSRFLVLLVILILILLRCGKGKEEQDQDQDYEQEVQNDFSTGNEVILPGKKLRRAHATRAAIFPIGGDRELVQARHIKHPLS